MEDPTTAPDAPEKIEALWAEFEGQAEKMHYYERDFEPGMWDLE